MKLFILILFFHFSAFSWDTDYCPLPQSTHHDFELQAIGEIAQLSYLDVIKDCFFAASEGAYQSVKDVVECVGSPIDCAESAVEGIKDIYRVLENISEELEKLYGSLSNLSPDQVKELICSVIGSMVPDIIVAAFTAGAGSGKIAVTVSKISLKIKKITDLLKYSVRIPIKILNELTDEVLEKLKPILQSSKKSHFENDLKGSGCEIR